MIFLELPNRRFTLCQGIVGQDVPGVKEPEPLTDKGLATDVPACVNRDLATQMVSMNWRLEVYLE